MKLGTDEWVEGPKFPRGIADVTAVEDLATQSLLVAGAKGPNVIKLLMVKIDKNLWKGGVFYPRKAFPVICW